jgi:hypothetical protein
VATRRVEEEEEEEEEEAGRISISLPLPTLPVPFSCFSRSFICTATHSDGRSPKAMYFAFSP